MSKKPNKIVQEDSLVHNSHLVYDNQNQSKPDVQSMLNTIDGPFAKKRGTNRTIVYNLK